MTPADVTARREALGLSRPALAELLGVSPSAVWRWETGERSVPPWLPLVFEAIAARTAGLATVPPAFGVD